MGAVSRLIDFRERCTTPTLVLVDLHGDYSQFANAFLSEADWSSAVDMCRLVLAWARRRSMPVAFVRHMPPPPSLLAAPDYPPWIPGLEPRRSDMIFERALPSCYASSEFAQMAARSSELVLCGLFGEAACLSTLIEAHHRNHRFTFLTDASCSHGHGGLSSGELHRGVIALSSLYARPSSARGWMDQMSVRADVRR